MGNNIRIRKCRRCKTEITSNVERRLKETRLCEHCLSHRKCTFCHKDKHRNEFEGNNTRCKVCTEELNKWHCNRCNRKLLKNKFDIGKHICKECLSKDESLKRKCKICKEYKLFEEFDYAMKTCRSCGGKQKKVFKKDNKTKHCRYCFKETENKTRVCNICKNKKKCLICKIYVDKINFETKKSIICKDCTDSIKHEEHRDKVRERISKTLFPIISKVQYKFYEELVNLNLYPILEYEYWYFHIDIALAEYKIAIEIDGDYWHGNPKFFQILTEKQKKRQSADKRKNTFLKNRNWSVLRFWENDIHKNLQNCINKVLEKIGEQKCLIKVA